MPRNPSAAIQSKPAVLYTHETPRTWFRDLDTAPQVTVRIAPREEDASVYLSATRTCHHHKPVLSMPFDSLEMLGDAAAGRTLRQIMEILPFTLLIEGVDRTFTHQLIRARVGFTYSETCTGDRDWRHANVLVPRPIGCDHELYSRFIFDVVQQKETYAILLDRGVSTVAARRALPSSVETFIQVNTNLAALSAWYAARSCTMTQDWLMVLVAEEIRRKVLERCPWAAPAFKRPCDAGRCWYFEAAKTSLEHVNYYVPDAVHDRFEWNDGSFLYDGTPEQVSSGPEPVRDRFFRGDYECFTVGRQQFTNPEAPRA